MDKMANVRRQLFNNSYEITVEAPFASAITLREQDFDIPLGIHSTIKDVKAVVCEKLKISKKDQLLIFEGRVLKDWNTLESYGIKSGSVITLVLKGEATPPTKKFKPNPIEGQGVANANTGPSWKAYNKGLSLDGTCPEPDCVSNKEGGKGFVIRQEGYGKVVIKNKVECPACQEGKFTPKKFIVSMGRALFRFKKEGGDETQLLESVTGSVKEFKEFERKEGYDSVEIETVEEDQSPYSCESCGLDILYKIDEILPECGHVQHNNCYSDETGCEVCKKEKENNLFVEELINLKQV